MSSIASSAQAVPPSPSSLFRLFTLAKFELVRLFLTKRGLLAVAAFTLVWLVILYYPVNSAVDIVGSEQFRDVIANVVGALGLSALLKWQVSELAIYWPIAVYSFPLFAIVIASDQLCSDRTRKTLRFIALRSTRNEILFGRFIGQSVIISLLILITLFATSAMALFRDFSLLMPAVTKSMAISVELLIIVLPFIALMTLFNSFMGSAKLVLVSTVLFFTLGKLLVAFITWNIPAASVLALAFPGEQISQTLNQAAVAWQNYAIPIIQTAVYLLIASGLMKRSSI